MFDNHNKVFAYKIELKLDPYLVALFNLCYDVYVKLENITVDQDEIEHAVSLFSDDFYEMLEINKNEYLDTDKSGQYTHTKGQFFDTVSSSLDSYYLRNDTFISKLKGEGHLYYFKDTFTIYSTIGDGKDTKQVFNNVNTIFKSIDIIAKILDNLNNEKLKEAIQSISTIYDFNKNSRYIKIVNSEFFQPDVFSIDEELINFTLLTRELFDFKNVWIDYDHKLCKDLDFNTEKDDYYLIRSKKDDKVKGLKVNNRVLLKYNTDFSKYIKEEFKNRYLWQLFKEDLLKKRNRTLIYDSTLIHDFKKRSKEREFNRLLCNLQHNLYIDENIKIKRKYKSFFEEFIIVNKLEELPDFNFFLPDDKSEKELLGIYSDKKIGTKYNLIHYLKHKDGKYLDSFVNSRPTRKTKEKVHILKAELSFYLIEKYYEDIIEQILSELQLDFLSNVELSINGVTKAEFDFVIFKEDMFYFIEAKTTLSKDNVYQTSEKYSHYIEKLKAITNSDLSNFRFILMGLLSDTNLNNYKHFFDAKEVRYNSVRKGFNTIPYKFNVPFFNYQKLQLNCIAEPEVSRLKEFIKEICQI